MICLTFCATNGLGDSQIPPISLAHNDIVDQMPVLWEGVHPGCLVQIGSLNRVLVIKRLCLVRVWRNSRPLLLHFWSRVYPVLLSQEALSCPTLASKSPRMKSLSAAGTAEITYSKYSYNLFFVSSVLIIIGA